MGIVVAFEEEGVDVVVEEMGGRSGDAFHFILSCLKRV